MIVCVPIPMRTYATPRAEVVAIEDGSSRPPTSQRVSRAHHREALRGVMTTDSHTVLSQHIISQSIF